MERTELYSAAEAADLKKKYRNRKAGLLVFVFAALAVCVALVAIVNTANAFSLRIAVTVISGVAGCIAIYSGIFFVKKPRIEFEHALRMLTGESEKHIGSFVLSGGKIKIFNSITVETLVLKNKSGEERLKINAEKTARLPADGGVYDIYTVYGYVTALERAEDENA